MASPRLLNLKQMIDYFLQHRREVVTRRTVFQLRKARERVPMLKAWPLRWPTSMIFITISKAANSTPSRARN